MHTVLHADYALQLRWHTRLAGRIERVLSDQPMDLEAAVVRAWQETAAEMPGVRMVLDRLRDEPLDEAMGRAMAKAARKEHVLLAVMSGRGGLGDELAVRVGEDIERRARLAGARLEVPAPHRVSLLGRIRAALVA